MEKELKNWLEREFCRSNLKKYHKYFEEWVLKLTDSQINGFYKQMKCQTDKSKYL